MLGQQESAQHRPEGRRLDRDARVRGDRLRGGIRLLAGDAALFDLEVRGIAGGVHARNPSDTSVGVDRQEPRSVMR